MVISGILREVIQVSKVTAKYQFTIPLRVRKELGIVPGTEVDIKKKGREIFSRYQPDRND